MQNPEGFDDLLKALCADECAEYGDPPCWRLPEKISDCEHITPCADCLAKAAAYKATMRKNEEQEAALDYIARLGQDCDRMLDDQLRDVRRACENQPASTKAHLAGRFKAFKTSWKE